MNGKNTVDFSFVLVCIWNVLDRIKMYMCKHTVYIFIHLDKVAKIKEIERRLMRLTHKKLLSKKKSEDPDNSMNAHDDIEIPVGVRA